MSYDPHKQIWFNPNIEYIFDTEIIEYDMKDAGFSIIKEYKLLPESKIAELERIGKGIERHIIIGKIQGADKEFSKRFSEKFADVRAMFIDINKLTDNDIISVKKDAIFTIGRSDNLSFGNIVFAEKNKYSSYIRFSDVEIYYSQDQLDVKGIGESGVNRHRIYMLDFIKKMIEMIECKDNRVKRYLIDFVMKYKNRELDEEYYIKFDRMSKDPDLLFNFRKIILPLFFMVMKEVP